MRLFVAVNLPEPVQQEINDTSRALRSAVERQKTDVKWIPPQQLHFTVKFLGDCMDDSLPRLDTALALATQDTPAFRIQLGDFGCFPEQGAVRIIWLGLREGEAAMKRLAAQIESACEPAGFPKEQRAFSAHLTVGRVKKAARTDLLREAIQAQAAESPSLFDVSQVELMQSVLTSHGPTYSMLQAHPLVGQERVYVSKGDLC